MVRPGDEVDLERTAESSPRFLEEHSSIDDLIEFRRFDTEEEQAEFVVAEVKKNLADDELRHDDGGRSYSKKAWYNLPWS